MAEKNITLVSKDGESKQTFADSPVNRAEVTRLRALGWSEPKAKKAEGGK